jgi:hypothetical protein
LRAHDGSNVVTRRRAARTIGGGWVFQDADRDRPLEKPPALYAFRVRLANMLRLTQTPTGPNPLIHSPVEIAPTRKGPFHPLGLPTRAADPSGSGRSLMACVLCAPGDRLIVLDWGVASWSNMALKMMSSSARSLLAIPKSMPRHTRIGASLTVTQSRESSGLE